MARFRALLCDPFITVEAENVEEAQLAAFARFVRDLSPGDFTVWQSREGDAWDEWDEEVGEKSLNQEIMKS